MGKRRVDEQAAVTTIPDTARPFMRWLEEDLTCRQAAVLAIVEDNPGVTVGAVAAVMGVPKPSVTRAADKLEMWGLLTRSVSRTDRRLVELHVRKQPAPARTGRSTRGGG